MNAIKATVQNGHIVTNDPIDLPEGTQLLVLPMNGADEIIEGDWDNSPEGIAAWLDWYDSLQPLIFTDAERHALEQDQKSRRESELAHADERAEKLRRLWG